MSRSGTSVFAIQPGRDEELAESREVPATTGARVCGRPGLAIVVLDRGGDGIGCVGRLLRRALEDLCGHPPDILSLDPARSGSVSAAERARFGWKLLRAEIRGDADWWIFNHVGIARAQRLIPRSVRRPYAVFLNGIEAWTPRLSADRLATLEDARVRISISHHTARRVLMVHPQIGPIRPCPLGLLDEELFPGKPDERLLDTIRRESVLIVGRMSSSERYKGHDELLECWSLVLKRKPGTQLVIVGDGDDAQRLKAKADALGLSGQVLFTGFVDSATLAEIWKRVAVFAMPSEGEGFGLVYLEAMRASLPCIGSTADAAGDIIEDGETGFLVDRSSPAGIADVIVRLLENADIRTMMGAAGRRRFEAEFTYARFVSRLRPILQSAFQY
jgi:phosphatidylinositol alpha-1,6-mannosyltransferase